MAKARKQKLKVFKTPIGFHDAYVAAPSRKAALEAWGADADLFSAGIAEQAEGGGKAAKAALEQPGEVVRVARSGGTDEPLPQRPSGKGGKRRKPKPSRAAVEKAEAAVAALEQRQAGEREELAEEEAALARRRRALEAKQRSAMARAEAKRDAAKARYRKAMAEWGG